MTVEFVNDCAATISCFIQWDGGGSGQIVIAAGGLVSIDISNLGIVPGDSCWPRLYVQDGPVHDSGDCFVFQDSPATVTYTITGSVDSPSLSCSGC
jgi:hypothetical protein